MKLYDVQLYRLARPPEYFEEIKAHRVRLGPNWCEIDETTEAWQLFQAKWKDYSPTDADIKRATAWTGGRSLIKRLPEAVAAGGHALLSIAKTTFTGGLSPDVRGARRLICTGGPNQRPCPNFRRAWDQCAICGCLLEKKIADPKERCPDVPARWTEHVT